MQAVIVTDMFGNNLGLVRDTLRAIKQLISDGGSLNNFVVEPTT